MNSNFNNSAPCQNIDSMGSDKSPLTKLMEHPDFSPLSGPRAFSVLELAEERLETPPFKKNDIQNAISSLGVFTENEVAMMCALSEDLCIRCGNCCRNRDQIVFTKQELKRVSNRRGISYKKLKQRLRAKPLGDGTFSVNGVCPFYNDEACEVYDIRPLSCRNYPAIDIVQALRKGKPEDIPDCPVVDRILLEMVVKRLLEERIFHEDPERYRKIIEKRLNERARLLDLPQNVRMQNLISQYRKSLKTRSIEDLY